MKTEFSEVAHLYYGSLCEVIKGSAKITAPLWGHWISVAKAGDPVYSVIPMLRPLSDMTEEERIKLGYPNEVDVLRADLALENAVWHVNQVIYGLSRHFDLFGLIESGQAIDATTMENNPYKL